VSPWLTKNGFWFLVSGFWSQEGERRHEQGKKGGPCMRIMRMNSYLQIPLPPLSKGEQWGRGSRPCHFSSEMDCRFRENNKKKLFIRVIRSCNSCNSCSKVFCFFGSGFAAPLHIGAYRRFQNIGLRFTVYGLRFKVQGSRFKVQTFENQCNP